MPAINPAKVDLSGKHVFLTEVSKGIGYATTVSFTKVGGSAIAISTRTSLSGIKQEKTQAAQEAGKPVPQILPIIHDVSDRSSVEAAAKRNRNYTWPCRTDNTGILETSTPVADSDPDVWWDS